MTFVPAARIDNLTAELWRGHDLAPGFDVEALCDALGLSLLWEDVEDDDGYRVLGQLIPAEHRVVLNQRYLEMLEANDCAVERFTIAHEIGHWTLHSRDTRSGTLSLFRNGRVWCRDGSALPTERQAEMFAARLLMPRDQVLNSLPHDRWVGWGPVYALAQFFRCSATATMIRLEELGFGHRSDDGTPKSGPRPPKGQSSLFDSLG